MAARRYEISLRVLRNISRMSAANGKKVIFFVSPSGHVVFFLIYEHQLDTKPIHIKIYFLCFYYKRCDLSCS